MTKTCLLDYDSIAGADKFGNIFVLRVPADVSDDVDNPTGVIFRFPLPELAFCFHSAKSECPSLDWLSNRCVFRRVDPTSPPPFVTLGMQETGFCGTLGT